VLCHKNFCSISYFCWLVWTVWIYTEIAVIYPKMWHTVMQYWVVQAIEYNQWEHTVYCSETRDMTDNQTLLGIAYNLLYIYMFYNMWPDLQKGTFSRTYIVWLHFNVLETYLVRVVKCYNVLLVWMSNVWKRHKSGHIYSSYAYITWDS